MKSPRNMRQNGTGKKSARQRRKEGGWCELAKRLGLCSVVGGASGGGEGALTRGGAQDAVLGAVGGGLGGRRLAREVVECLSALKREIA